MLNRMVILTVLCSCLLLGTTPTWASVLVEAYNEFDTWTDGTWFATQVALQYIPTSSYSLERVEFYTGGSKNGVTIALRPDDSGAPSAAILTSGTYNSTGTGSWQGATFSDPYSVVAGTTYWVTWYNTEDLLAPYSVGTNRTVRWGEGSNSDDYPNLVSRGFKTKFYSAEAVVPEPFSLAIWATLGGLGLIAARPRRPGA